LEDVVLGLRIIVAAAQWILSGKIDAGFRRLLASG